MMMKIDDYVLVTKKDSELYRRRCQIIKVTDDGKYKVYSEGLEQDEVLPESDLEPSKF
ncbi:hypothetical protein [Phascolarctobacterium sp.]|uniref:hypothetical protein n=1 Tax=Phascolarctobacterium sp. TaxID=2049039 RepID=UPI002A833CB3|nr:hypothetical protein [Phascolarctobacterium sp.]MDY5045503.1 hypothetical protein [Phascolarctobacterium sp.]